MKKSKNNKILSFFLMIVIYLIFVYLLFLFTFSFEEKNTDLVNNTRKNNVTREVKTNGRGKLENINGINIANLSTTKKVGQPNDIITDKEVNEFLNNSKDTDVKFIMNNINKIGNEYKRLLYSSKYSKLFIKDLIDNKKIDFSIGESVKFNRNIPYYIQWDRRWGRHEYAGGNLAINGCGPTCLSMVVSGILNDKNITPITLCEDSNYTSNGGTTWEFFNEVPKKYGIETTELSSVKKIYYNELKSGRPIVVNVGAGDFTSAGHYIVLVDMDEDGMLTINDPNNPDNTNEKWSFERLKPQIKNGWSFRKGE